MVDKFGNIIISGTSASSWSELMIQKTSKDAPLTVVGGVLIGYNYDSGGKLYRFKATIPNKTTDIFYTDLAMTIVYARRLTTI